MNSNKPVPGGGGGAGMLPNKSPGVAAGANGEADAADGEAGAMSECPQSG
jgi:hypothetical protein